MIWKQNNINLDRLSDVAQIFANIFSCGDVVILKGDIGAGKTTLVSSITSLLGTVDVVTSPTFAIVNTYEIYPKVKGLNKIIHVDTYRLDHLNEVYDLGLETIFDEEAVTFIEWGEKIEEYVDKNHFVIEIDESQPEDRNFVFQIKGEIPRDRQNKIEDELVRGGWENYG